MLPTADIDAVAGWMDGRALGSGPISDVTTISGGTQNVMVRFTRDGKQYVLRRGPLHLRPRSNAAIARETRVLAALRGTGVPHPALIDWCEDESVLGGAVFYLMEPINGFNANVELPTLHASNPEVRRGMGFAMVDAVAALGAVDHVAVGLTDFGKPDGFLERQVPRWLAELDSYTGIDGYPGPEIPGVAVVASWLERHRPERWRPGILHGDYHAANVMFAYTGPEVVAIVDWEMCTIGDPLLDLGWLVATSGLRASPDAFGGLLTRAGGLPAGNELIERYAARSDRDLAAMKWYVVLACFKLGIVLEGSLARAMAGLAPMEIGERLHHTTVSLFEQALDLVESDDRL